MTNTPRIAAILAITLAATAALAQSDAQKSFTQLKSLSGTWEGNSEGKPLQVSFRETAGGSALMSEIQGNHGMISMFHLDGPDRLLMTHYCAAGNEPRMQASVSPDGKPSPSPSSTAPISLPAPVIWTPWSSRCSIIITIRKIGLSLPRAKRRNDSSTSTARCDRVGRTLLSAQVLTLFR